MVDGGADSGVAKSWKQHIENVNYRGWRKTFNSQPEFSWTVTVMQEPERSV